MKQLVIDSGMWWIGLLGIGVKAVLPPPWPPVRLKVTSKEFTGYHYIGPTPCDSTALCGTAITSLRGLYREWNQYDVIQALNECSNPKRRREFAEWQYFHHRDEFEKVAGDIFAD
ncbi:hypothetical protein JG688_00016631 [Phytophthora aleatoria]|uniref:Uncharacterized protein n=1 Tax=Phytophthora aleatoria TaxID=2496075 RepID=A0A8J5MCB0_9STRA|nr:hypothetical protein JG688_00016631 [Phytophthora aleatoria]